PGIGGAIGGIAEQARPIPQVEPAADDEPAAVFLRRLEGAHRARERVAVGDRDGAVAEPRCLHDQLLRMRGAAQKREIAGDLELDVAGHGTLTLPLLCNGSLPPPLRGGGASKYSVRIAPLPR